MNAIPPSVASYPLPATVASLGMIHTVLTVLLTVAGSLAVSWPVMTLAAEMIGDMGARTSLRRLAVFLARRTPGVAVFSIALGIPAYFTLFVMHGDAMFPAVLRMGWIWLAGIFLLFAGVGSSFWVSLRRRGSEPSTLRPFLPDIVESYLLAFRRRGLERPGLWFTLIAAASFLLFGFIMISFGVLVERPDLWGPGAPVPDGFFLPLADPKLVRRMVHFILWSFAIGGFAVAWHGADRLADGEVSYGRSTIKFGAVFFAVPVALEAVAGPWLLMSEPAGLLVRTPLAGGGLFLWTGAGAALLAAVLVSFSPVIRRPRPVFWASSVLLLYSISVMVLVRQQARELCLSDAGRAIPFTVHFHEAAGLVAASVAVAALVALGWMLAATTASSGQSEGG